MRDLFLKNQSGQAVIEYVFVLAFIMVLLVTFVREYSGAVGRSIQTLNYTLSQSLTSGVCTNLCFFKYRDFENPVGP